MWAEVQRRTEAAVAWLEGTFALAREDSAKGVVLALHGDADLAGEEPGRGFQPFVDGLKRYVAAFPGSVLLIHGDSHIQRMDQPLKDPEGRPYPNFTRLETFGSPEIGWVRIVVDTVAGRITTVEPRKMRGWW